MTLRKSATKPKTRWMLLGVLVLALTVLGALAAQAALDTSLFELDKDATNNTHSIKIGVLNANLNDTATTAQICQDAAVGTYDGALILIDAERITLGTGSTAPGGGCPSGYGTKVNYTGNTRHEGTTAAGAHSKGEDVTHLAPGDDTHDWNQVYAALPADDTCASLGAVACDFTHDGRAMSIFTQSKDYDEISNANGDTAVWQWRDQSVPDADELDDAFAVKYVDPGTGDQNLFFGADRFAVNGSKDAGFWFFHKTVTALDPVGGGDGTFSGLHTAPDPGSDGVFCNATFGGSVAGGQSTPDCAQYDSNDTGGDVLALTTFTQGGAVTTIRLFEWIGPAGSDAALLERATASDCVPGPVGSLCATVNDTTIESPWNYSGKGEPADNEIPAGGFLEGGINLSDLGLEGCFSSYMATTRSSPSVTADPKDFILGQFEACDTQLTTTPLDGSGLSLTADSDNPANYLDEISIGSGSVTVKDSAELDVKGTSTFTGNLSFYLCGPIDYDNACSDSGVDVGFAGTNPVTSNGTYYSNTATLTEVGRYCWYAFFDSGTEGVPDASDGTIESASGTGECFEVVPVKPGLSTAAVAPSVNFGSAVQDKATLSGTATQPNHSGSHGTYDSINPLAGGSAAGGTIKFTLLDASCEVVSDGGGTNPQEVSVNGDGVYGPVSYTPQSPGTYNWKAEYIPAEGDTNNLGAVHNADCSDPNERVVVQKAPTSITTGPWVYPNDSATVSVALANQGTGFVEGSVTFRLFDTPTNCNATEPSSTVGVGGLLYMETVDLVGDSYSETVSTANTSVYVDTNTTVYWLVEFSSTNTAQFGRNSICSESIQTILTDDTSGGTAPS